MSDKHQDPGPYTIRLALRAMRAPMPDAQQRSLPKTEELGVSPRPETVAQVLVAAQADASDEALRLSSFQGRGGQLAGFSGVLLGLLAAFIPDGFDVVSGCWVWVTKGLFIVALLALVGAAGLALFWVVRPVRMPTAGRAADLRDIAGSKRMLESEAWQLQYRRIRAVFVRLAAHEWANKRKAGALYIAYLLLAVGLVLAAACIVILTVSG